MSSSIINDVTWYGGLCAALAPGFYRLATAPNAATVAAMDAAASKLPVTGIREAISWYWAHTGRIGAGMGNGIRKILESIRGNGITKLPSNLWKGNLSLGLRGGAGGVALAGLGVLGVVSVLSLGKVWRAISDKKKNESFDPDQKVGLDLGIGAGNAVVAGSAALATIGAPFVAATAALGWLGTSILHDAKEHSVYGVFANPDQLIWPFNRMFGKRLNYDKTEQYYSYR